MSEQERVVLMGQVAQMYYEQGATQESIADALGLSRPTVSRILREAREAGVVEIIVHRPAGLDARLASELQRRFPVLRQALVVDGTAGLGEELVRRNLGRAAADFLLYLVRPGDCISVTWGQTMAAVAEALAPRPLAGVTVVQLNGGVSRAGSGTNAGEVVGRFGRAFGAAAHVLPVPAIVESATARDLLVRDRHIAPLLDLARGAGVAVFSIGALGPDSMLCAAGYFAPPEYDALVARGAVGDICSRFFTRDGEPVDPDLDRRTVGIELGDLRQKPYAVAVAGGARKVPGILGALRGRLLNVLITDAVTARQLLAQAGPGGEWDGEAAAGGGA